MQLQNEGMQGPEENTKNTGKGAGRCMQRYGIISVLILLLSCIVMPAAATDPTVLVTDYTVTPAVLMPGDIGTIVLTITNTASSASEKENTGIVSGGTFESTKSTDINVFIENVHLEENGIDVLTDDFDRLGELGPGQSVPVTFLIRAPARSGIYFPGGMDRCQGRAKHPLPAHDQREHRHFDAEETDALGHPVAPGTRCSR